MKIVSLINPAKDIATTLNIQIQTRRIIEKYLKKGEQAEVWECPAIPGENTILFETDSVLQFPD